MKTGNKRLISVFLCVVLLGIPISVAAADSSRPSPASPVYAIIGDSDEQIGNVQYGSGVILDQGWYEVCLMPVWGSENKQKPLNFTYEGRAPAEISIGKDYYTSGFGILPLLILQGTEPTEVVLKISYENSENDGDESNVPIEVRYIIPVPACSHLTRSMTVLKDPTCTEPGVQARVCKNPLCGFIETSSRESISALGRAYCYSAAATSIDFQSKH